MKLIWIFLGCFSLGIGAVGAVLPFLPTFPFLMLTLFCFAKSSRRLHQWFLGTKLYHDHLESYVKDRSMTVKTKVRIVTTVTLLMGFGFVMMAHVPAARILLVLVWLCHVLYFWLGVGTIKEEQKKEEELL